MNKRSWRMLLAINLLLLVALAVVNLSPQPAAAQFGMRGDYVMISGAATGSNDTAAIYLLDLKSQRMAALLFDSRSKKLRTIAGRIVSNDLRARGGR